MISARLPLWVDRWIGIPYEGCDCYELCRRVLAAEAGIIIPEHAMPETDEERARAIERGAAQEGWDAIEPGQQAVFDLAEMLLPVRGAAGWAHRPLHIGVVVSRDAVLHTLPPHGSGVFRPRASVLRYWRRA